jgi:hypothetical protein
MYNKLFFEFEFGETVERRYSTIHDFFRFRSVGSSMFFREGDSGCIFDVALELDL